MSEQEGVVFLRGAKTVLRPINKETDAELLQRWVNDPEIRQFLHRALPVTLGGEIDWIDSLEKKSTSQVVLLIETKEGTPIGTMGIHSINWVDRVGGTGALVGEKDFWGKGYGTDAKMALLLYAFGTLNLRKICSEVFASNTRSQSYLRKTGYKEIGTRAKDVYRGGKYVDVLLMEIFKPDFMKIWKEYKEKHNI